MNEKVMGYKCLIEDKELDKIKLFIGQHNQSIKLVLCDQEEKHYTYRLYCSMGSKQVVEQFFYSQIVFVLFFELLFV